MQKYIFATALAVSVVSSFSLPAAIPSRRQYVEVQSCVVQKGKIVVTTATQIYQVKRLRTDSKGAYVCPSDIISIEEIEHQEP